MFEERGRPRVRVSLTWPVTDAVSSRCPGGAPTTATTSAAADKVPRRNEIQGPLRLIGNWQRDFKHLLECRSGNKAHMLSHFRGKLRELRLVVRGQHKGGDAVASRCQRLLANAADGKDQAAQGDLTGHRHVFAHGLVLQRGDDGRGYR